MAQKEHIVKQAAQMFASYGIKAVRMDDIAHELGVSKRTLYELFGDKEELLFEAIMELFNRKRTEHTTIAAKAENVLEAMFMVLNEIMLEAPLHDRLTANLRRFYPKVFERVKSEGIEENNRSLRLLIEKGVEQEFFVGWMNLDLTISLFCAAARSLRGKDEQILVPEGMTEREAFMQLLTTLFRGIATTKGRELIDKYSGQYLTESRTNR